MKRFRFPLRPVAVLRAHRELKAREAFAKLDQPKAQQDFLAAAAWVRSRPDSTGKLGAVGFCYGGGIVHMLATLLLAGAMILFQVVAPQPLLFWLLAFYWVSLAALVVVFVRAIKHAPPQAATTPAPTLG